jgi:hypothetical protein
MSHLLELANPIFLLNSGSNREDLVQLLLLVVTKPEEVAL